MELTELENFKLIPFNKNLTQCLDIIKQFIIDEKLLLVGGMGLHLYAEKHGDYIYDSEQVADYDIVAPNLDQIIPKVLDKLSEFKEGIQIINAFHFSTVRVRYFRYVIFDVSFIPKSTYDKIPTTTFKNIKIPVPYQALEDQLKTMLNHEHRMDKDLVRFITTARNVFDLSEKSLPDDPFSIKYHIEEKKSTPTTIFVPIESKHKMFIITTPEPKDHTKDKVVSFNSSHNGFFPSFSTKTSTYYYYPKKILHCQPHTTKSGEYQLSPKMTAYFALFLFNSTHDKKWVEEAKKSILETATPHEVVLFANSHDPTSNPNTDDNRGAMPYCHQITPECRKRFQDNDYSNINFQEGSKIKDYEAWIESHKNIY